MVASVDEMNCRIPNAMGRAIRCAPQHNAEDRRVAIRTCPKLKPMNRLVPRCSPQCFQLSSFPDSAQFFISLGRIGLAFLLVLISPVVASAQSALRHVEHFDADPGWDSYRNRLTPNPVPIVRQDFGYRETNHAGGQTAGEIGGWIQRSITPAWYAKVIPASTLEKKLTASGTFAVMRNGGGSGALFGWFNEQSRGWRTPNSLAFRIDGNGNSYWLLFEYGTRNWLTGGGATFEGRYQTTKTKPFAADGTPHRWSLTYDPAGNGGEGLITFSLDGREYTARLGPGHKADGAMFDRFGLFNQQSTGAGMEVYFSDLVINGEPQDLSSDPRWEGRGNQAEFAERAVRPMHDFGFTATQHAGGKAGELGGIIWRDEAPAYYADAVGPFTLQDELRASGTIAFTGAGSDSGVFLGWFNSAAKQNKTTPDHKEPPKHVLAIAIEGPSRVGHYFRPAYYNRTGRGDLDPVGPIIRPTGQVHSWSLHYSPSGAKGNGEITVKFDDIIHTTALKPGFKQSGATFDRFGLFNMQTGGHYVFVYLDDVSYSKRRQP